MDTPLSTNLSKFSPSLGSPDPIYPGDLINNDALYVPQPRYTTSFDRRLAMNAELFTCLGSRAEALQKKAFIVGAMSTGYNAYAVAERYASKIAQNTEFRMGEKFLTIQRLSDSIPSEVMKADVLARNAAANESAAEIAAHAFRDHRINAPADREAFLRSIHEIHPILGGAGYEDWTFEKHMWGPEVLHDVHAMILHGDRAYSRCGAMEEAVAVAIQYGQPLALTARNGVSIDVKDIYGRDVAPVDQAWETARMVVDVVERGFRAESAVALMLSRFMHDDWFKQGAGPLIRETAHPSVRSQPPEDRARMQALKELMIPYMAAKCDWKTLHAALDRDPSLKTYWNAQVAPAAQNAKPAPDTLERLFAYQPRGGFAHPEYHHLVKERRDPPEPRPQLTTAGKRRRPLGAHEDPFDPKWRAKIFEDHSFERLGPVADPAKKPDKDHLNFEQAASYIIMTAVKKSRPPLDGSKTLLYLANPASGIRAAQYFHEHGISHWQEAGTSRNPMKGPARTFYEDVIQQNAEDYGHRLMELMRMEGWRREQDVGRIMPMSDFAADATREFERRRKAIGADRREALATEGQRKLSGAAEVCIKRYIDHEADGIVIPAGPLLDQAQYRYITEALLVATGQIERPYSGGKYQMEFFYDDEGDRPPRRMDLGDLLLLAGATVEHALDEGNPPRLRAAYVSMARLLDIYEKRIDPARCNVATATDPATGSPHKKEIIDWTQVDAANPGFTAFLTDDPFKAQQVHALWQRLRGDEAPETGAPVRGKLLIRGIHAFEDSDLRNLPPEYRQAKEWWSNLSNKEQQNVFNANALVVREAAVFRP